MGKRNTTAHNEDLVLPNSFSKKKKAAYEKPGCLINSSKGKSISKSRGS